MSKHLFKVLLIWLCALSFPLQGMAAVVMLSCGGSHHQAMTQLEEDHEAHAAHHGMAHDDAPSSSHASQDHGHAAQHGHGQSADKCSACASCCIGVGMAATLPQWRGDAPEPSDWVASARMLLPSFMSDGLERPPRSFLA